MINSQLHDWNTYESNLKDFNIRKIYTDSVKKFNEELQTQNQQKKSSNKCSGSSVLKMYKYYHNFFKKRG